MAWLITAVAITCLAIVAGRAFAIREAAQQEVDLLVGSLRAAHWDDCERVDCAVCGVIDCPHRDPTHHARTGCDSCSFLKRVEAV